MDNLYNILWVFVWNCFIPILIGYFITKFIKTDRKDNLAFNFVVGFIAMLGIFQPITLLAIYFKTSLTLLTLVMKVIWIIVSILSLMLNAKRFIALFKVIPETLRKTRISIIMVLVMFLLQAYAYVGYQHIDDDDAFFVATATTAIENDNLYVKSPYSGLLYTSLPTRYILSPFSIFYAVMSKLTNIHATIYAHLYLPVILLSFVYLVYYLWGKEWFEDSSSLGLFLILVSILNIFGNYTEFTTQTFLLSRLWQGKAILAAGIIPFLLYLCYIIRKIDKPGICWVILIFATSAATHVSSMGIFLTPITVGCFAMVDAVQARKIKRPVKYILSCFPCVVCGVIYLIIR